MSLNNAAVAGHTPNDRRETRNFFNLFVHRNIDEALPYICCSLQPATAFEFHFSNVMSVSLGRAAEVALEAFHSAHIPCDRNSRRLFFQSGCFSIATPSFPKNTREGACEAFRSTHIPRATNSRRLYF